MIVDGILDVMRFRVAVNELIHRYEVLRMNFQLDGEIPYQFLRADEIFKLNMYTQTCWRKFQDIYPTFF